MTHHMREALKGAVAFAIKDLADLARLPAKAQHDVLPKEAQLQCAMFAFFKGRGCTVQAEATYPKGGEECDLTVRFPEGGELWIEIKNAWSAPGWVNKPVEQRSHWLGDLRKLRRAPKEALRAFVLAGYFSEVPSGSLRAVPKAVLGFCPEQRLSDSPCVDFAWRDTEIRKLQIWAWVFSAKELDRALSEG